MAHPQALPGSNLPPLAEYKTEERSLTCPCLHCWGVSVWISEQRKTKKIKGTTLMANLDITQGRITFKNPFLNQNLDAGKACEQGHKLHNSVCMLLYLYDSISDTFILHILAEKEALRSLSTLPHQQTEIKPTPSEAEGYHTSPFLLTVRKDTSLASDGDTPAQVWSYRNDITSKSAPGRGSFPSPPSPSVHHDRRDVGSLANSTLESIRLGNIVAGKEQGGLEHSEPNETYRKHRGTWDMKEYSLVTAWYILALK